ncbi:hypothetical protein GCM10027275_54900 [Rhabdobacter roseus]|uniref:Peroxiredoxin n=1 Tax=Rhabdobacter roseus TaxID=1655419 RepID=A0A840TX43_9BACT|nr:redoxin domain-containing protein [Rhabdobacter roseus]MBB5287505.1 peroxiredoxin [Rhabdobacter roseus]
MLYEIIDEEGNVHSYELKPRLGTKGSFPGRAAGEQLPYFELNTEQVVWAGVQPQTTLITSHDLVREQPLVVAFHCECWGAYAPKIMEALITLNEQLISRGARLLVLTQEPVKRLKKLVEHQPLAFDISYDEGYRIATQLGVYLEDRPVWDRVAGISEDVYYPGLFLVDQDGLIQNVQVDQDFEMKWDFPALLDTLAQVQAGALV